MKIIKATGWGGSTLVAFPKDRFPIEGRGGNCFSLIAEDKEYYSILNMGQENLEFLFEKGTVSWPLKLLRLDEKHALVYDPRVPDSFYRTAFCDCCTPERLMPLPQRIAKRMAMARGQIKVRRVKSADGTIHKMVSHVAPPGFYKLKGKLGIRAIDSIGVSVANLQAVARRAFCLNCGL